ncbi:hypothetical protein GCM10027168_31830 [Streptomyces capparidis]
MTLKKVRISSAMAASCRYLAPPKAPAAKSEKSEKSGKEE